MKSLKSVLGLLLLCFTSSFVTCDGMKFKYSEKDIVKTVVVGHEGAADFKTIQAAIDSIPSGNNNWIQIYLKDGTYNEKIVIPKDKQKIIMEGNNALKVIIQYNDAGDSSSSGPLTNTNYEKKTGILPYGEIKVAPSIIIKADKVLFNKCRFISVQDTVADLLGRHYFNNCYIEGAIDFIWGRGQSIYQNCIINVREVTSNEGVLAGFITAQGRESEQDTSGFVFNKCVIKGDGKAFLGRAYRGYSRVIFNRVNMSNVTVSQGWDAWKYKGQVDKLTYVEENCIGEGANKKGRVRWEKNLSPKDVHLFTEPKNFIDKDGWMATLPSSVFKLYN